VDGNRERMRPEVRVTSAGADETTTTADRHSISRQVAATCLPGYRLKYHCSTSRASTVSIVTACLSAWFLVPRTENVLSHRCAHPCSARQSCNPIQLAPWRSHS